jgi:hypothetical protein
MFPKVRLTPVLKALLFLLTAIAINPNFIKAQGNNCKPFDFNLAPEYQTGQNIYAFGSADLNGDGHTDVVTTGSNGQAVSVLYGDGTGGFAPPQVFSPGTTTVTVLTVADVNNDGKPDVIGASSGATFNNNKIVVLLNNGQGGFLAPVVTDLPNNVIEFYYLKVADFNGDGNADVAGLTKTNLNFFLGNGQGGFTLNTTLPWNGAKNTIVTGNFNNDNFTDLAVTGGDFGSPWELGIVLGAPGGGFVFNSRYTLTGQPSGLDTGEFNGDGKTDIVISANYPYANSTPQTRFVETWIGNGGGGFTAAPKFSFRQLPRASSRAISTVTENMTWQLISVRWSGSLTVSATGLFETKNIF